MKTGFRVFKWIIPFLLSVLLSTIEAMAQGSLLSKLEPGVGFGIDYGGFGTRLTYLPKEHVALFGSLGYNLNFLGYNFGAQVRLPVSKRIFTYVTAMYGYNAVLKVEGLLTETANTYYGPSVGLGGSWYFSSKRKLLLNLEVLKPFRPQAYSDAIHDLKKVGYEVKEPWPIGISLGLHYRILQPAEK